MWNVQIKDWIKTVWVTCLVAFAKASHWVWVQLRGMTSLYIVKIDKKYKTGKNQTLVFRRIVINFNLIHNRTSLSLKQRAVERSVCSMTLAFCILNAKVCEHAEWSINTVILRGWWSISLKCVCGLEKWMLKISWAFHTHTLWLWLHLLSPPPYISQGQQTQCDGFLCDVLWP